MSDPTIPQPDRAESPHAASSPVGSPDIVPAVPAAGTAVGVGALIEDADVELPKVRAGWIVALVFGVFGAFIAYVTPIAISLALRVDALAPENSEYLGILLSVGALAALAFGPIGGQLSDRTRTRLGRRRPWMIGSTLR